MRRAGPSPSSLFSASVCLQLPANLLRGGQMHFQLRSPAPQAPVLCLKLSSWLDYRPVDSEALIRTPPHLHLRPLTLVNALE